MRQNQRPAPQHRRRRASASVMILKGILLGIIALCTLLGLYSVVAAVVGMREDVIHALVFLIPAAGSAMLILYARLTMREVEAWDGPEAATAPPLHTDG